MNLRPPPDTNDIEELREWCSEMYEFLKFPHFHGIRLVPRASHSETQKGVIYYDSDTDKVVGHNGTAFQDFY